MLRPLQIGLLRPISYTLDPNARFQPGMIAQLQLIGNDVCMGVSDGIAPFGILDDVRDTAYVEPQIDEQVIITANSISTDGYNNFLGADQLGLLQNSQILEQSWVSDIAGIELIATNGAVIARAGTTLNYKVNPNSVGNDAILATVRYSYYVPNKPGEDTTAGSSKVTIWVGRGMIFQTDQYETTAPYSINAALFVSSEGKLTTDRRIANQPAVGMVIVPPTSINNMLEFLWG